jgi:DNA-binding LytR/AlgR family response regulator
VFWQIHRATIVNSTRSRVAHDAYGHVVLKLKQRKEMLRVSETYAHLFRQM